MTDPCTILAPPWCWREAIRSLGATELGAGPVFLVTKLLFKDFRFWRRVDLETPLRTVTGLRSKFEGARGWLEVSSSEGAPRFLDP